MEKEVTDIISCQPDKKTLQKKPVFSRMGEENKNKKKKGKRNSVDIGTIDLQTKAETGNNEENRYISDAHVCIWEDE